MNPEFHPEARREFYAAIAWYDERQDRGQTGAVWVTKR